jgi:hypothetical protein
MRNILAFGWFLCGSNIDAFSKLQRSRSFRLQCSSESEDKSKLAEALRNVRRQDPEWLSNILSENGSTINNLINQELKTPANRWRNSSPLSSDEIEEERTSSDGEDDKDAKLLALDYSEEDIATISSDVCAVLIERSITRPRQGIPHHWKINSSGSKYRDEPITLEQKIDGGDFRSEENNLDSSFQPMAENYFEGERDIEANGLLPDKAEFRDMLMDECKFRIGMFGDWITPSVKAEAKWRYNVYSSWLGTLLFLKTHISPGFSISS